MPPPPPRCSGATADATYVVRLVATNATGTAGTGRSDPGRGQYPRAGTGGVTFTDIQAAVSAGCTAACMSSTAADCLRRRRLRGGHGFLRRRAQPHQLHRHRRQSPATQTRPDSTTAVARLAGSQYSGAGGSGPRHLRPIPELDTERRTADLNLDLENHGSQSAVNSQPAETEVAFLDPIRHPTRGVRRTKAVRPLRSVLLARGAVLASGKDEGRCTTHQGLDQHRFLVGMIDETGAPHISCRIAR